MIDFDFGWRAVPGMFNHADGDMLQRAAKRALPGTAIVETGAWCGRSLAAILEVLPKGVKAYSIDNYLEDSQAAEHSPIPAIVAKRIRGLVGEHYQKEGRDVVLVVDEASKAGTAYTGPPVSVLFIDDHHSGEQVEANLVAWLPHMASKSAILLHDYGHVPYGIIPVCNQMLPPAGYIFLGTCGGLGIWDGTSK